MTVPGNGRIKYDNNFSQYFFEFTFAIWGLCWCNLFFQAKWAQVSKSGNKRVNKVGTKWGQESKSCHKRGTKEEVPKVGTREEQSGNKVPKVCAREEQSGNKVPKVGTRKEQSGTKNPRAGAREEQSGNKV